MTVNATPDPLDLEVERVLHDPALRRRLEDFERRVADGDVRTVPHEVVPRRPGLYEGRDTSRRRR